MKTIQDHINEIIKLSEQYDEFYEVEVSVMVRTHDGEKSEFMRSQSHSTPEKQDDQENDNPLSSIKENPWF